MVGVGTSKIVLSDWKFRFCSMLGIDSQSWGYSYHGNIQHNQLVRKYASQFGLGSIVGVHLDMCNGTLEYYVNRKPMGIAFKGLKGRELYPMVSSTAAQSAVRITCAVSEEPTLQMRCLEFISKHPTLYKRYKEIPGLIRLYERKYFWILPTNEQDEKKRISEMEEMCPMNYKNFLKRNKKLRAIRWIPPEILHVREEGEPVQSDSDLETMSTEESSILTTSPENSSSSSGTVQGLAPSTSKQGCDESRTKIRRTDSFGSHADCSLHDGKKFCAKCKFRMQIEDENMSDSSGS
ncbi:SPRY domain-containing SOCS box protein 3 isoform X2 [Anoplophora glabripennis]|nr:SPRY domain-containing SOCS box protein 3 isoform X2 [Anoplophora glabripennis]